MPQLPYSNANVEDDSRNPLPNGRYRVQVMNSEMRENSQGTGELIRMIYRVVDGPFMGRTVSAFYNVVHRASPDAERIGRQQLKSVGHACGNANFTATEELHGSHIELAISVDGTYNRIDGVFPVVLQAPAPGPGPMPASTATAPSSRPPWAQ